MYNYNYFPPFSLLPCVAMCFFLCVCHFVIFECYCYLVLQLIITNYCIFCVCHCITCAQCHCNILLKLKNGEFLQALFANRSKSVIGYTRKENISIFPEKNVHSKILMKRWYSSQNETDKLTLNSFNCWDLRNKKKRLNIFHWLKTNYSGITALKQIPQVMINKFGKKNGEGKYFSHMDGLIALG